MKRLLLILFFSPIILSAQEPVTDVIDPNPEAILNLRSMALAVSNDRCVKVADILFTHNGEYTSVAVFLRDTTAQGPDPVVVLTPVPETLDEPVTMTPSVPDTGFVVSDTAIVVIAPIVPIPDTGIVVLDAGAIVLAPVIVVPDTGMVVSEVSALVLAPLIAVPDTGNVVSEMAALVLAPLKAVPDTGVIISEEVVHVTVPLVMSPDTAVVLAKVKDVPVIKADTVTSLAGDAEPRLPVAEMHLSKDGYSLLQKLEGYSPSLYSLNDGGFTIGFGFFVPFSEGHKWSKGISWAEAENMMRQKVPAYEAQVKQYVNVPLTQNEFDALTMLAYNLGGFSKATSIINDINEQVDIEQLQRDWKKFVHSKAPNVRKGLMNRRNDEIEVRKISNYQPERKILIYKSRK